MAATSSTLFSHIRTYFSRPTLNFLNFFEDLRLHCIMFLNCTQFLKFKKQSGCKCGSAVNLFLTDMYMFTLPMSVDIVGFRSGLE